MEVGALKTKPDGRQSFNFSALQPGDPAGVDHLPRRGRDLQDLRAHRVPRALRVGQGPAAQAAPGGRLRAEQCGQGRGD